MTYPELLDHFDALDCRQALVEPCGSHAYVDLAVEAFRNLGSPVIDPGSVVALVGGYSPRTIAWQFALLAQACVVIPIGERWQSRADDICDLTQAELIVEPDRIRVCCSRNGPDHPLYRELRAREHPGMVLMSEAPPGILRAIVHDAETMLLRAAKRGEGHRRIACFPFDEIEGQYALLDCLVHGGCVIAPEYLTPSAVCGAAQEHQADFLQASPDLLGSLLERAEDICDLSSLRLISYGAPIPEATLAALAAALPQARWVQHFARPELGVLCLTSRSGESTWAERRGSDFEFRAVDGRLEVRAQTTVLGCLNGPNPFSGDGWMQTGDFAEQDGNWIRILGHTLGATPGRRAA